jgi:hypothetical protein
MGNGSSCANPPAIVLFPLLTPDADIVVADDEPMPVSARSTRIRKARTSCMRKARKAKSRAKVHRRVRACRRAAARRSRAAGNLGA